MSGPAARDFAWYWSGQSVSVLGDQIAVFVLPTLAITTFGASALQVGVLTGLSTAAYAVLGLPAGAWLDRSRRRPALIGADVLRGLAFGSVPVAAAAGRLSLPQLYLVALVAGVGAVVFNVASQSHLPVLVPAAGLGRANARLELSGAVALVAGPAVGGLLVQWLGAATALTANALSFLASVLGLLLLRTPEPPPPVRAGTRLRHEIRDGLRALAAHPVVRRTTVASALRNYGNAAVGTIVLLFAYRGVGLSAGAAGLLFAAGTVAALAGAAVTARLLARAGVGRSLLLANGAIGVWVLAPLALWLPAVPVLLVLRAVSSMSLPVWNATVATVRQSVIPASVQGRVNASAGTVNFTAMPLGAVSAGVAAQLLTGAFGVRAGLALALAGAGLIAASGSLVLRHPAVQRLQLAVG